uniref:OCIA domain-containing protein n=1 Tax=Ursus americanus TaxID=9643 RepID=A0A452RIC5_URSAM
TWGFILFHSLYIDLLRTRKTQSSVQPETSFPARRAVAGLLGFALGKASYIRVCQSKFHSVEDQLRGAGFGPGHNRHCLLTCEECKIKHGLHEKGSSQPSAS